MKMVMGANVALLEVQFFGSCVLRNTYQLYCDQTVGCRWKQDPFTDPPDCTVSLRRVTLRASSLDDVCINIFQISTLICALFLESSPHLLTLIIYRH